MDMVCLHECGWSGKEDQTKVGYGDVYSCPWCGEEARYANYWLVIRIDGGMYRGTGTFEAEDKQEAIEYAYENYTNSIADLGVAGALFGPFRKIPKDVLCTE